MQPAWCGAGTSIDLDRVAMLLLLLRDAGAGAGARDGRLAGHVRISIVGRGDLREDLAASLRGARARARETAPAMALISVEAAEAAISGCSHG